MKKKEAYLTYEESWRKWRGTKKGNSKHFNTKKSKRHENKSPYEKWASISNLPFTFWTFTWIRKTVGFILLWCQSLVSCALSRSGRRSIPCRFINCSFIRWQPNIFLFHQRYEPIGGETNKKNAHERKYRTCFLFSNSDQLFPSIQFTFVRRTFEWHAIRMR